jgi:histidinol-phosphate/aromatic aminotransferase/cobyric acid decarboxylase-like protein
MSNKLAIELLLRNRTDLFEKRERMLERYNKEIAELEKAIEELSGKRVWETQATFIYDDESQDYIKSSSEEI